MSPGTPTEEPDGSLRPASPSEVAKAWFAIEQVRGDESLRMGVQEGRNILRLRTRYRAGLNTNMYALLGAREFHFQVIENVGERNRETVILAVERLRT